MGGSEETGSETRKGEQERRQPIGDGGLVYRELSVLNFAPRGGWNEIHQRKETIRWNPIGAGARAPCARQLGGLVIPLCLST